MAAAMIPENEEPRREELERLRLAWNRKQAEADNLLQEIKVLERELAGSVLSSTDTLGLKSVGPMRYGRIRADILSMLADAPAGLDSITIGKRVKDSYGDAISPRTHLTTLKRLKDGSFAVKINGRWLLTAEGHQERFAANRH